MNLNSTVKAAVAAVALAIAGTAAADINTGNTSSPPNCAQCGNGELFLSIWNPLSQLSYVRDLGINLNNFLPTTSTGPNDVNAGATVDYNYGVAPTGTSGVLGGGYKLVFGNDTSAAATTLGTILGQTGSIWNVTASDNVGSKRLLFTSNDAAPVIADAQLTSATGKINTFLGAVNGQVGQNGAADPTSNGSSFDTANTNIGNAGNSGFTTNYGGITGLNSTANIGSSLSFWFASTNPAIPVGQTAVIANYTNATWTLNNTGGLTYEVTAVPEPGTWAMLMAGLVMVGGIARRRMSV